MEPSKLLRGFFWRKLNPVPSAQEYFVISGVRWLPAVRGVVAPFFPSRYIAESVMNSHVTPVADTHIVQGIVIVLIMRHDWSAVICERPAPYALMRSWQFTVLEHFVNGVALLLAKFGREAVVRLSYCHESPVPQLLRPKESPGLR